MGATGDLTGLSVISIVGHGASGEIGLGSTAIDKSDLSSKASALSAIGKSIATGGELALYACDTAAGATGQQFIADLSKFAGGEPRRGHGLYPAAPGRERPDPGRQSCHHHRHPPPRRPHGGGFSSCVATRAKILRVCFHRSFKTRPTDPIGLHIGAAMLVQRAAILFGGLVARIRAPRTHSHLCRLAFHPDGKITAAKRNRFVGNAIRGLRVRAIGG